jgi:hypothetical protein
MDTRKFNEQSIKECVDILVQSVNQIRKDNNISENKDISIYVIDAPIVHSAVTQFGKHIQEQTNAHSIVQVNLDVGNPMPDALPQIEVTIGDDPVVIAVEQV